MAKKAYTPESATKNRKLYARMLIISEGEKTEPTYFKTVIKKYDLRKENITIIQSSSGSAPMSVAESTEKEIKKAEASGNPYNHVFCVVDRDEHENFDDACNKMLQTCKDMENKDDVLARSWPCFEYWLLSHYTFTRAPFTRKGDNSPCKTCLTELAKHINVYEKNHTSFDTLMDKLDTAITNAKQSCKDADRTDEPNPSTEVYKILECLKKLKKENRLPSA